MSPQQILTTVMTRIVVDKSTHHAKPHSLLLLHIHQTGIWVLPSKLQHGGSWLVVFYVPYILLFPWLWKEKSHKRGKELLFEIIFKITLLRTEILHVVVNVA